MDLSNATDVVDYIQDTFELVADVTELAEKSKLFEVFEHLNLGVMFGAAGLILDLLKIFLPDVKFQRIMSEFEHVHQEMDQIKYKIDELSKELHWETTILQYIEHVNVISLATDYTVRIGKAEKDNVRKDLYQEKLKDTCGGEKCQLAINAIIKSSGDHVFYNDILEAVYFKSGGSRPAVVRMCGHILQLLTGGMTSLFTYETMRYGLEKANISSQDMEHDIKTVKDHMTEMVGKCEEEYNTNLENDMVQVTLNNEHSNNADIVKKLVDTIAPKYDWLDFQCAVYNNIVGYENHYMYGSISLYRGYGKYVVCYMNYKHLLRPISSAKIKEASTWTTNGFSNMLYDMQQEYYKQHKINYVKECNLRDLGEFFSIVDLRKLINYWDLLDASCICELYIEAIKRAGMQIWGIGCWNKRKMKNSLQFYQSNNTEANRRICKNDLGVFMMCLWLVDFHPENIHPSFGLIDSRHFLDEGSTDTSLKNTSTNRNAITFQRVVQLLNKKKLSLLNKKLQAQNQVGKAHKSKTTIAAVTSVALVLMSALTIIAGIRFSCRRKKQQEATEITKLVES